MEITLDQALQKGIEAGKAQEADRYYTSILKAQPKHPDANHNMGVLAVGVGKVEAALPFFKTALEANPNNAQYWLSYIDALIKLDRMTDAKAVFDQAKSKGAKGDGFDQIEKRLVGLEINTEVNDASRKLQDPLQDQLQPLINLYTQGQYKQALIQALDLVLLHPKSIGLHNIIGALNKGLGNLDEAIRAFEKAISIKADYAEGYNNIGYILQDQGKLAKAIETYEKVISIKPDYAPAYTNIATALLELGRLEEAIEKCKSALSIKPNLAEAHYNIGIAYRGQGKLNEAIAAFTNALSIKPDFAEAYKYMGNALHDQDKLEEAVRAYNNALSIKFDYAEAHRNISLIKKYSKDDDQIIQVQELYRRENLSEDARCSLCFALAKMYEDIGELHQAFKYLSEGNVLRKQQLKYSIKKDMELFSKLKNTQPHLLRKSLQIKEKMLEITPVFILGMPRSGTTLVEQIISSHSEVFGAGELKYVEKFGKELVVDATFVNTTAISEFRESYFSEVSKLSNGKYVITDKMPQNFRFIPLICAAFPEAKIIHLQRNAAATCWSNYKQYFISKKLGYCYDLKDLVAYYNLYTEMMKVWQSQYGERIYNLNYEQLTNDQEDQTRKLIKHLGLNWEEACLSPHKNKRSVRTASQQQVRKKVYQGSSHAWRKYEPFLNGAFDSLKST